MLSHLNAVNKRKSSKLGFSIAIYLGFWGGFCFLGFFLFFVCFFSLQTNGRLRDELFEAGHSGALYPAVRHVRQGTVRRSFPRNQSKKMSCVPGRTGTKGRRGENVNLSLFGCQYPSSTRWRARPSTSVSNTCFFSYFVSVLPNNNLDFLFEHKTSSAPTSASRPCFLGFKIVGANCS